MNVEIALEKIEPQAAEAYVDSIDAQAEHAKLAQGLEDAFEAMLAHEDEDERVLYMNSAENALTARDGLASVRAAATLIASAPALVAKMDAKLAAIDAGLAQNARLLVALNALRRREASALDAPERAASWWYSARSNCDFLASLYQETESAARVTQKHNAAHLATCADCQRDVESASLAYTPKHIPASSLWRREQGHATSAELAFMDSHAAHCKDCKRAVDALAVREED